MSMFSVYKVCKLFCVAEKDRRAAEVERLIEKHRKSASWVARKVGANKQSVINWIDGTYAPRDETVWEKMLGLFPQEEVSPLGAPLYPVPLEEVEIPLWPALPCDENWDDLDSVIDWVAVPGFLSRRSGMINPPERFAANIRGNSMAPRLRAGDLLIYEKDSTPRPGRIVVVRGEGKVTVKVLRRGDSGHFLEPINPASGEVVPRESQIEGYAIAILRDYATGRGNIEWDEGGIGP